MLEWVNVGLKRGKGRNREGMGKESKVRGYTGSRQGKEEQDDATGCGEGKRKGSKGK